MSRLNTVILDPKILARANWITGDCDLAGRHYTEKQYLFWLTSVIRKKSKYWEKIIREN